MSDKLKLLGVDELTMGEVPVLEKMSGFSVLDVVQHDGGSVPMSVLMALAYLTERRGRPYLKQAEYTKLTSTEFMARLEDRFEFDTVDDEEDGQEDPTNAA
jgi:hypothetical protein